MAGPAVVSTPKSYQRSSANSSLNGAPPLGFIEKTLERLYPKCRQTLPELYLSPREMINDWLDSGTEGRELDLFYHLFHIEGRRSQTMLDILFDSGEHGIEKESMKRSIGAKLLTLCNKNGDIRKNRARLEWSYRKSLLRMASQLFEFNDVKSLISSIYMDQSGFFYRVESDTLKRKNNEPVWDVHYVRDEVGEIVDAIEYRRVD